MRHGDSSPAGDDARSGAGTGHGLAVDGAADCEPGRAPERESVVSVDDVLATIDAPRKEVDPRIVPPNRTEASCAKTMRFLGRARTGQHTDWPRFCDRWHCPDCCDYKTENLADRAAAAYESAPYVSVLHLDPDRTDSVLRNIRRHRDGATLRYVSIALGGVTILITNVAPSDGATGVIGSHLIRGSAVELLLYEILDSYHLASVKPVSCHTLPELDDERLPMSYLAQLTPDEVYRFRDEFRRLCAEAVEMDPQDPRMPDEQSELYAQHPELFAELEEQAIDAAKGGIGW